MAIAPQTSVETVLATGGRVPVSPPLCAVEHAPLPAGEHYNPLEAVYPVAAARDQTYLGPIIDTLVPRGFKLADTILARAAVRRPESPAAVVAAETYGKRLRFQGSVAIIGPKEGSVLLVTREMSRAIRTQQLGPGAFRVMHAAKPYVVYTPEVEYSAHFWVVGQTNAHLRPC